MRSELHVAIPVTEDDVRSALKRRDRDAHKGDFGRVLVYAGSVGMAGAAILCARAALKSGAGLVRFLLMSKDSRPLIPILQTAVPEATCLYYKPNMDFNEYAAIAAGPGLGTALPVHMALGWILDQFRGTLVMDADALNVAASDPSIAGKICSTAASVVLTPHVGEARRLLTGSGSAASDEQIEIRTPEQRLDAALSLAEKYKSIVCLKGAGTLTASFSDGAPLVYRNTTGNPGMATGGSGDVLTGLIASLAAQGYPAMDAARFGVFLHGAAGDLAAAELGEMGLISSDIAAQLPYALKKYYP